jgi:hypothetical protein
VGIWFAQYLKSRPIFELGMGDWEAGLGCDCGFFWVETMVLVWRGSVMGGGWKRGECTALRCAANVD